LSSLFFASCNSVKYVPEDKYLLNKNIINVDNKDIPKNEIEGLLKQKSNKKILGYFKFHMGLYNLSKPGSEKWFSRTMRKIGEEPVIYDKIQTEKSDNQILLFFKNKGYYNAVVSDTVIFYKKKANVTYTIHSGKPYTINNLNFKIDDKKIQTLILNDTVNSLLKSGTPFDVDNLQNERQRIETFLKNKGYFAFSKEDISFEADSDLNRNEVNLMLNFKNETRNKDSIAILNPEYTPYKVGDIQVIVDKNDNGDTLEENNIFMRDTFLINDIYVIYKHKATVKPSLLANDVYIEPDELFNQNQVDETYRSLSALHIFKFVNIVFSETPNKDSSGYKRINCQIYLTSTNYQSYQTEGEITYSSGLGVAGSLTYQHKNLFKGAENLNLSFKAATEAIKEINATKYFQTYEYSGEAKIQFPKFLLPNAQTFVRKYNPRTELSFSYNYLERPDYTISTAKMAFGYNWKGNKYTSFQVLPINLNYVRLLSISDTFKNQISNTVLQYSFQNHMVSVTSLNFTFNNQKPKKNTNFYYIHINIESAGNVLDVANKALNNKADSNGYTIFKIPFSQFIKSDIDFRYYLPVNETDKIVYRIFGGAAFPYGNSKTIPFEEEYFSGGAYGIRAWQARSLGPGSYLVNKNNYPDEIADIKLEGNIEYRFKLFWILEGALFVDAGNIWSIDKNDPREGAVFKGTEFYKQIAVGSGIGTRFDFSFFIFRFDVGFKMRDPSEPVNFRWCFNKNITSKFLNYNIGIGYPF
jgi:outer membrane protein assembly factor BamA